MSDLANLVETLERIGIPREWSKKRYLSNIDWNEVKKYEIDTKIDQTLNTQPGTSMGDMEQEDLQQQEWLVVQCLVFLVVEV